MNNSDLILLDGRLSSLSIPGSGYLSITDKGFLKLDPRGGGR